MSAPHSLNRQMFWRIIRRLVFSHRGRLFVILLALGAGATVTAALLNLQVDAKRRITADFRAFGANVLVTPSESAYDAGGGKTFDESVLRRIAENSTSNGIQFAGFLYAVADVSVGSKGGPFPHSPGTPALFSGYSSDEYRNLLPSRSVESSQPTGIDMPSCDAGSAVAKRLNLHARDLLFMAADTLSDAPARSAQAECFVRSINSFGGGEDDQIFVSLPVVQKLARQPNRLSVVQLSVPGTPKEIAEYVSKVRRVLPEVEVRPIRQFTEGEAKIYDRISSLLTATVAVVLLLTSLCVMAAMANVAVERRNDVALMKAIGGAKRRVLRIFLAEAGLLGFAGGLLGAAAGLVLSIWLGKQVFGVAAEPRLIVYPIAVALTTFVAILSAFPLRRLASVRPASVFRGEA